MERKSNWSKFKRVLDAHNIKKLYHFTDFENLKSIISNGGLFSWKDCDDKGICIPKPGGSPLSRELDGRDGLERYVRLSFTTQHPMMYEAMKDGRLSNPVVLEIDPEVVFWKSTLYSDRNATKNGAQKGDTLDDFKSIHFDSVKARNHFDLDEDEQPFFQAEVLVKNFIPLKYIMNIGNFGLPIPVQPDVLQPKIPYLNLKRPEEQEEELSTKVTKEDRAEAWVDEYGAKYSKDRKRLLKVPRNIEEYAILPGTRVVCDWAFCDCDSLSSVVIPDSVTSIGNWAFYMCISLRSIMLPKSLKEIVGNPLAGLKITITNKSPYFNVYEGNLYDSGRKRLIAFCSGVSDFVIPDSVTTIGDSAFCDCSSLSSVVIPASVTTIGDGAFYDCSSLSSVVIPASVTTIGDSAFCGCSSLSSVVIPASVTAIGDSAFCGCGSLSSVVIPASVTAIGDSAFSGCRSLSSVVIPDSVTTIGDSAFWACYSLNSIIVSRSAYERVCGMLYEEFRSKVVIKEDLDSDDDLPF